MQKGKAIEFITKSSSKARDLFYEYDALQDFRDSNVNGSDIKRDPRKYVRFTGLGLAILLTLTIKDRKELLYLQDGKLESDYGKNLAKRLMENSPSQSVVIIDEIDKAPRDFPNDLLHEIARLSFWIPELNETVTVNDEYRPIIIITSNSEKQLPDPFLRRCAFVHLPSPRGISLEAILRSRLPYIYKDGSIFMDELRVFFEEYLNTDKLNKPVATSELIEFAQAMHEYEINPQQKMGEQVPIIRRAMASLAKTKEDAQTISRMLNEYTAAITA